jgi:hypothetical protein
LFKKPAPRGYAFRGEKVYSAYGSNAEAVVHTKIKLDQTKLALLEAEKEANKAYKQKEMNDNRIEDSILELISIKDQIMTTNETLVVLQKGLKSFAELKEGWQKLLLFFDKMATNIKSAMGEEMTNLCLKVIH